MKKRDLWLIATVGLLIAALLLVLPFLRQGERGVGVVENIDGISYARAGDAIQITEKLAHADIYLTEPVAFKKLVLTVTFDPQDLEALAVGVRENSFWLSYPQVPLYEAGLSGSGKQTREITIPLTDKLQEPDDSIDIMLFATHPNSSNEIDEGIADPTHWILHDVTARVETTLPTYVQLKDFIRAQITRENAL